MFRATVRPLSNNVTRKKLNALLTTTSSTKQSSASSTSPKQASNQNTTFLSSAKPVKLDAEFLERREFAGTDELALELSTKKPKM